MSALTTVIVPPSGLSFSTVLASRSSASTPSCDTVSYPNSPHRSRMAGSCRLKLSGVSSRFALYSGNISRCLADPPLSKKTAPACGASIAESLRRLWKNACSAPVGKPSERERSGIA